LLALPLIVIVALTAPGEDGAKPTVTEHFPFGLTWPVQLVETANSFDPEKIPPLKIMAAPPFFLAMLVKVMPFTLLLPILTLPKLKKPFETLTLADTLGVGVGVGVGGGGGVGVGVGAGVAVDVGVAVGVGVDVAVGVAVGVEVGPVLLNAITKLYALTVPIPVAKSQPVVAG